ncbi:MAG: phosphatidylglycerophosphatase A family protein [Candidatus Acidiferrales bacterium]
MKKTTDAPPTVPARKPWLAYAVATVFGIGYIPLGPGTWASALAVLLHWGIVRVSRHSLDLYFHGTYFVVAHYLSALLLVAILLSALLGLWSASRVAKHSGNRDPSFVVMDEVSGQLLTLFIGGAAANWKYLLAGFILFRGFDIWKPFPVHRAESLPGGLGIMADDWVAAVYAGLILLAARHLGF